ELSVDAFEPQPAAVSARSGRGIRLPLPLLAAVGAAVLALAGAAAWYFTPSSHTPASAPAPVATAPAKAPAAAEEPAAATAEVPVATPSTETLIVHGKVDELLEKARLAMKERRFTEPAGDNALLFYRSAVAADATNADAREARTGVAPGARARLEKALGGGPLEEPPLTLANLKSAAPKDARLVAFEKRLYAPEVSKALNDGTLERALQYVRQAQQSTAIPA